MTTKQLILTALVLIVIAIVLGAFGLSWNSGQQPTTSSDVTPPSPEVIAMVQASKGFQYLVSYTDSGFEPVMLTIKKGETVRFTNNSSHDMWVVDTTDPNPTCIPSVGPQPAQDGTAGTAEQATFNSCKALKHGEFWEHTFTTTGTIQYMDSTNTTNTGIVQVQ